MITWRTVESSNITAVGWYSYDADMPRQYWMNPATMSETGGSPKLGLVQFKDGRVYGYLGAARQRMVYMATRCKSPGAYCNSVMRLKFKVVRLPELDNSVKQ